MGKKLNTEKFIILSNSIHNNKFDYSLVDYKNNKTKVKIICPKHGVFEQIPQSHIRGSECLSCFNEKQTLNNNLFKEKSEKIHFNKYDYSLVDYKNNREKVKIQCLQHGIFEIRPSDHLRGYGCRECGVENKRKLDELIKRAKIKHKNKYDYSSIKYYNHITKVDIICPEHGVFKQTMKLHVKGSGCPSCYGNLNLDTKSFVNRSKSIHEELYDYSLVNYKNNHTVVKIICRKHGVFEQKPMGHLIGYGCPICRASKGEKYISKFLEKNKIKYIKSMTFTECRNILPLKFDFYLPDLNVCIEYDGIQHFKAVDFWGGDIGLKNIKKRDMIKTNFCLKNNITLIRIAYFDKNIDKKLKELCTI